MRNDTGNNNWRGALDLEQQVLNRGSITKTKQHLSNRRALPEVTHCSLFFQWLLWLDGGGWGWWWCMWTTLGISDAFGKHWLVRLLNDNNNKYGIAPQSPSSSLSVWLLPIPDTTQQQRHSSALSRKSWWTVSAKGQLSMGCESVLFCKVVVLLIMPRLLCYCGHSACLWVLGITRGRYIIKCLSWIKCNCKVSSWLLCPAVLKSLWT